MNTIQINADTKFRLRVYSLNTHQGWTEYSSLAALKDGLTSEEKKCRKWAKAFAAEHPNDFNVLDAETGENRPMTADEISDWVDDAPDESGNYPDADVAVFEPDVEAWDERDESWETIPVCELP